MLMLMNVFSQTKTSALLWLGCAIVVLYRNSISIDRCWVLHTYLVQPPRHGTPSWASRQGILNEWERYPDERGKVFVVVLLLRASERTNKQTNRHTDSVTPLDSSLNLLGWERGARGEPLVCAECDASYMSCVWRRERDATYQSRDYI